MLQTQVVILDSWQDASVNGGRRLTRAVAFNGDKYTVVGLPSPSKGGPVSGDLGTLVFLPGEGEYQHVVTCVAFKRVTEQQWEAILAQAKPAPALAARTPMVTQVLSPEEAEAAKAARAARRLANNQSAVSAALDASSVPV